MIHNSNSAQSTLNHPTFLLGKKKIIQNVPKSIRTTEGSKHSGTNLNQENMWSYKNKSNVKLPSGQAYNSGQQASGGRKLSKIAHPL